MTMFYQGSLHVLAVLFHSFPFLASQHA